MPDAPIQPIVDNDLCIACGACVEACPPSVIEPGYSEYRGAWEVRVTDTSACTGCSGPCGDVCPSINVFLGEEPAPLRVGPVRSVQTGYAPAFRDNGVSSSGGVLRALVSEQLARGIPVVALVRNTHRQSRDRYAPAILHNSEDLETLPGSIYHSVGFYSAIELLRTAAKPLALVALPCQLEGINNYLRVCEPSLESKISLRIGVICGWMYSDHALDNYLDAAAINGDWIDAQYRGEDEVGRLKIITTDAAISHSRREFDSWRQAIAYHSSFSRDANRLRCRLCQNHVNVGADIAVGDAWLQRLRGEKSSVVVVRSTRAEKLVDELLADGSLVLEPGHVDDIIESQSENLVMGLFARQFENLRRKRGLSTPRYHFADGATMSPPKLRQRMEIRLEMYRRKLLRESRYRLYRRLHLLTRPRAYLDFLLRRARGILTRGARR